MYLKDFIVLIIILIISIVLTIGGVLKLDEFSCKKQAETTNCNCEYLKRLKMSEKEEIIIDGVDVSTCRNITFEHHNGKVTRFIVCECGVQDVEHYNVMCSDNPDCYYKQLQRLKVEYRK